MIWQRPPSTDHRLDPVPCILCGERSSVAIAETFAHSEPNSYDWADYCWRCRPDQPGAERKPGDCAHPFVMWLDATCLRLTKQSRRSRPHPSLHPSTTPEAHDQTELVEASTVVDTPLSLEARQASLFPEDEFGSPRAHKSALSLRPRAQAKHADEREVGAHTSLLDRITATGPRLVNGGAS